MGNLPTAEDMREFASYFHESVWEACCEHEQYGGEFMDGVSYDIKKAGYVAMVIFEELGLVDEGDADEGKGELVPA
jgi:hypothetical protein